jgi:tRNA1(Val) A37 N6-methylase TrmN6
MLKEATTCDAFLDGRMRLIQPRLGHRIGTDAILLAACAPGPEAAGELALADLGAGVGAVGIAAALRLPDAKVQLVENDPDIVGLATENLRLNRLDSRVSIVAVDVFASARLREAAGLSPASVDIILSNPPFASAAAGRVSPNEKKRLAHVMQNGDLEAWLRAAAHLLKPHGTLALIHRADALKQVLDALSRGFGALRLIFVHPTLGAPATRLLVRAVRQSRAPLQILVPIILHEAAGGGFTPEAEALHRGAAIIDWVKGGVRPL